MIANETNCTFGCRCGFQRQIMMSLDHQLCIKSAYKFIYALKVNTIKTVTIYNHIENYKIILQLVISVHIYTLF